MAPRVDYSEDWQLECGEIKQRGAHLLRSELWSDCSFVVGDQPGQVLLKAHKLILAMASPVFQAMFFGPVADGTYPITIPDVQPQAFRSLLEYIYTDNIELDSFNSACDLYYAAQKYMLPHLLTVCTMYLSCNLTPEVVFQTYEFALLVGEETLIKECEQVIKTETSSILSHKSYENVSAATLEKIFSMDRLNIKSELDLFKATEHYAKALNLNGDSASTSTKDQFLEIGNTEIKAETGVEEPPDNQIDGSAPDMEPVKGDETNSINDQLPDHNYFLASTSKEQSQAIGVQCKALIRKLVQQIRFLTLTPCELAEYPTLASLLTDSEMLALMMNAASPLTHMPMPDGFSLSRTKR